jgi:hypothetical protein
MKNDKIRVKNLSKYLLTIKPNLGVSAEAFSLSGGKYVEFENSTVYSQFANSISSFVQSGMVAITLESQSTAKTEVPEAKKVKEPAVTIEQIKSKLEELKAEYENASAERQEAIQLEVKKLKGVAKKLK